MSRQIVLDTETTGLSPAQGHRVIEIGCLEMMNRRLTGKYFHHYIKPERDIDPAAEAIHGITQASLADKPVFSEINDAFIEFIKDAELIIHNAPFDVGFLNHELKLINKKNQPITTHCNVIDTLVMARKKHPGQHNSLDALCRRYNIDNSNRDLHGALLDAELLAQVYLLMTGGQTQLFQAEEKIGVDKKLADTIDRLADNRTPLRVIPATPDEVNAHQAFMEKIEID